MNGVRIISLPRISDERGSLTFMEGNSQIPFEMKRIYYVYGVPESQNRGAHANIEAEQIIIAVSGKFDVTLDDGDERKKYTLESPDKALYVPPKIWVELENFSAGAVMLVLRPTAYDKNDYIRDYEEFRAMVKNVVKGV